MDWTPGEDVIEIFRAFWRDRAGVTAVEYALIAGLIALVIITAVSLVGTNLTNFFLSLGNNISTIG
ncbi:MAG TPA: Flp family type IVb pilin [Caulobacteraceae bacterium]|jgi:pilus assembly protein Flp/PilA|nr:Flp family type IVb pilin [Caulobacteraceae bacterium]